MFFLRASQNITNYLYFERFLLQEQQKRETPSRLDKKFLFFSTSSVYLTLKNTLKAWASCLSRQSEKRYFQYALTSYRLNGNRCFPYALCSSHPNEKWYLPCASKSFHQNKTWCSPSVWRSYRWSNRSCHPCVALFRRLTCRHCHLVLGQVQNALQKPKRALHLKGVPRKVVVSSLSWS